MITVIIPVYNAERYLERCLESVINNTYKDLEILLVDDGSTDTSPQICDDYAEKDDRIIVIHQANSGTSIARNKALDLAKGDFIAFCDNDDYISPYFYENMIKVIYDTNADIVVSEMTRDDKFSFVDGNQTISSIIVNKHDFILDTYSGKWTRNTAPWNKLYKRELFDEIRFPSGKGYEDAYTTYRLLFKAKKIAYLDSILYCWFMNEESYSSKKSNVKKLLFREEAIRLQFEFYEGSSYNDVKKAAQKFYLQQLMLMLFQTRNDFAESEESIYVYRKLSRLAKRSLHKYGKLCDREERKRFFEYLHPIIAKFMIRN